MHLAKVSNFHMGRLLALLLLSLAINAFFVEQSVNALTIGPLVTSTIIYGPDCASGNCTTSFYNVPDQCNPVWNANGGIESYAKIPEACRTSSGFCSVTIYDNDSCSAASKQAVLVMSSVGINLLDSTDAVISKSDYIVSAEKDYIFVQLNGLRNLTYSIAQTTVCSPVFFADTPTDLYSVLKAPCASDDPFVQIRLFTTDNCASESTYTDLSAVVVPHSSDSSNRQGPISTYISGGLPTIATAKCYGSSPSTTVGTQGAVIVSSSSTACNEPLSSYYFANSDTCAQIITLGLESTIERSVKLDAPCHPNDEFLTFTLYSSSPDCTGPSFKKTVRLGSSHCNAGDGLYETFQCATTLPSSSSTMDLLSFNLSSSDGTSYNTYVVPNVDGCHPAYNHATTNSVQGPDFYIKASTVCTSTPLDNSYIGIYSTAGCSEAPFFSAVTSFWNLVNAYNASLWFSGSCPNAAASSAIPTLVQVEVLGEESCTAETPSGIYQTLYFTNGENSCASLQDMAGNYVGDMILPTTCTPENEFMFGSLFPTDSFCASNGQAFTMPLGSHRCFNLPTALNRPFPRAVRARCPPTTADSTASTPSSLASLASPLSYVYVEEYLHPSDCLAQTAEPARSYAISQVLDQCFAAPLWASLASTNILRLTQLCSPDDPVMNFELSEISCNPGGEDQFGWITTRNDGNLEARTTPIESGSTRFPPRCNIGFVNGQTVATKVTCFGSILNAAASYHAVISKPTKTTIYKSVGPDPCYSSYKVVPDDTESFATFSHLCSPNDAIAQYVVSASSCEGDPSTAAITELNKVGADGSSFSCFQRPSASPRNDTSFIVLESSPDTTCSAIGSSRALKNVINVCQTGAFNFILTEACYEDDPFIFYSLFVDEQCSQPRSNFIVRQGRDQCSASGIQSGRAYCIQPSGATRPAAEPLSEAYAKVYLTARGLSGNNTWIIDNGPSVTASSCLPVISPLGTAAPVYYAKLLDGRCSAQDVVTRIAIFSDVACSTSPLTSHTLMVGANYSNVHSGVAYTVECFTANELVPAKSHSVLFASQYGNDNGCVGSVTATSVIALTPGGCAPVERANASSPAMWAKANISCGSAQADSSGMKAMQMDYYTTSTCSPASKVGNSAYLYTEAFSVCSIDQVFAPVHATSFIYKCFQSNNYIPPAQCSGTIPGPSFVCINGTWVLQQTFSGGTLTIPSSTTVQVLGDVNVTQSIVLSGFGSSLTITGCLFLNGSVQLFLTSEDIGNLTTTGQRFVYITYSSTNCTNSSDLSIVDVNIATTGNTGCKKLRSKNDSTKQTLALTFSIDDSGCGSSRWWIILVAVVGAVVLLVILVVLIVTFVPAARAKVRPFWVRSQRREAQGNVK